MNFNIELNYTNGTVSTVEWSGGNGVYSLGDVILKIQNTDFPGEYTLSLSPGVNSALSSLTLTAVLPESRLFYFNNGDCTNVFCRIVKCEDADFSSRDIIAASNNRSYFNIAFSTFDTFFTRFYAKKNQLTIKYFLENKVMNKGEIYKLENLYIDTERCTEYFFESYGELLAKNYSLPEVKPPRCGWSSWSCLYGGVTEADVIKQANELHGLSPYANLIQIDDGWQKSGSFGGLWTENAEKFPSGMVYLEKELKKLSIDLGLWVAPGMLSKASPLYEKFKNKLYAPEDEARVSFSDVVPLDISDESVLEYTKEIFTRLRYEYNCTYFKIDFLTNLLYRAGVDGSAVEYKSDYSVRLYRKFIKVIREAVGDAFLLACGAPVGEGIGIFDGIRTSADITWGGASNPGHPGAWNIIRNDMQSVMLRGMYSKKVYVTDPDALLVRNYASSGDDGLILSLDEAKMWASAVALSGGHILINEELDRLSEERLDLIKKVIPPLGIAAVPDEFFEYPYCTCTYANLDSDGDKLVCAIYNYNDYQIIRVIPFAFMYSHMYDCFTKQELEYRDNFTLSAHTCKVLLLSKEELCVNDDLFFRKI